MDPRRFAFIGLRPFQAEMERIISIITNTPVSELHALGLSGTHLFRYFPPFIADRLHWGRFERDCLGDWSPPPDPSVGPQPKRARKVSVSERSYVPNATRAQQLEIRARFQGAIATAIAEFGGVPKLTPQTTWEELVPDAVDPASALHPFYFPLDKYKDRA